MGQQTRRCSRLLVLAFSICLGSLGLAEGALPIGFDSLSHGTPVTNQFQSSGVLFESNSGQPCHAFNGVEATSPPIVLVGIDNFSDIFMTFVDPTTGLPSPLHEACLVSFNVISVGHAVITVTSRASSGGALESFVLNNPGGPVNGFMNIDPVQFTVPGMASVEVVFTVHAPPGQDGIGIDDLVVEFDCTTPVETITWGAFKARYE